MRELPDKIETRQQIVRETTEQLRDQIARLTEQLSTAEDTLRRLQITRETLLEIAGDDDRTPDLVPSAYRQILALFENAEDGLRAKDVCRALGVGAEPRHTEGTRAKLKRLVSRGVLIEPEPGLFTIPQPSRTTTVPPSSWNPATAFDDDRKPATIWCAC